MKSQLQSASIKLEGKKALLDQYFFLQVLTCTQATRYKSQGVKKYALINHPTRKPEAHQSKFKITDCHTHAWRAWPTELEVIVHS